MPLRFQLIIVYLACGTSTALVPANYTAPQLTSKTAQQEIWRTDSAQFVITTASQNLAHTVKKISYYHAQMELGSLYYERFPLGLSVIHSFWIQPKYRRHGYGLALLQFTCQQLQQQGVHWIFIQPGPFEQANGKPLNIPPAEKAQRLAAIIRLYQKAGFQPASRLLCWLARGLYPLLGIDEDANYLMTL